MAIKKTISDIASMLLILLFVYASVSKLIDFQTFRVQMLRQPLADWITTVLIWTLLPIELIIAGLLAFERTRMGGLYASFIVMLTFTGYVALALTKVFGDIPCACGGVLKSLDWESHLVFNIIFTLIALLGLLTTDQDNNHAKR